MSWGDKECHQSNIATLNYHVIMNACNPCFKGITYRQFMQGTSQVECSDTFYNLMGELIEHLWQCLLGRMCASKEF